MLGFVYLVAAVGLCLLVANVRRSTLGQQMLAVRSNERAAAAAGISVTRVKFTAYAISSFIAGTAGWMYAYNFGSVSAARFGFLIALGFVAFAYIGGITMVSGAIIGGLVATEGLVPYFFQEVFGISGNWSLLVRRPAADRHPDPEPRRRRRHDLPQVAAQEEERRPPPAADRAEPSRVPAQALGGGGRTMTAVLSARSISVSFGGVRRRDRRQPRRRSPASSSA